MIPTSPRLQWPSMSIDIDLLLVALYLLSLFLYILSSLMIVFLEISLTTAARQKIRAASAGNFLFMRFALIGSLESPPSI